MQTFPTLNVNGVGCDIGYKLCHGILYFQNVIKFHSTSANLIPFMPSPFWFSWNYKNHRHRHADISHLEFHPDWSRYTKSKDWHSFTSPHQVRMSLSWFPQNSCLIDNFVYRTSTPNFMKTWHRGQFLIQGHRQTDGQTWSPHTGNKTKRFLWNLRAEQTKQMIVTNKFWILHLQPSIPGLNISMYKYIIFIIILYGCGETGHKRNLSNRIIII